jgi:hypothetical protein
MDANYWPTIAQVDAGLLVALAFSSNNFRFGRRLIAVGTLVGVAVGVGSLLVAVHELFNGDDNASGFWVGLGDLGPYVLGVLVFLRFIWQDRDAETEAEVRSRIWLLRARLEELEVRRSIVAEGPERDRLAAQQDDLRTKLEKLVKRRPETGA